MNSNCFRQLLSVSIIVFLFYGMAISVPSVLSENSRPRMVFDQLEHDFGHQIAGAHVKHIFSFRNAGDAPLFIESVKAG